MPWVTIKGNWYYRRNRREGGRVVVEHIGNGRLARLEEKLDIRTRELRRMVVGKERGEREEFRLDLNQAFAADRWLAALFGLLAHWNGYHLHRRQWRRKRGWNMAKGTGVKGIDALLGRLEPKRTPPLLTPWLGDLPATDRAAVEAAAAGDADALAKVRPLLDDPKNARTWGNPAYMARCWLVHQICGDDEVVRRAVYRQIDDVNKELGYQGSGYLERMAISRVVHNWLMTTALEAKACSFVAECRQQAMVERALSQAERRYMQALRTLVFLRRISVDEMVARVATVTPVESKALGT